MLSTRTEKRLHGLARSSMNGHKVRDVYRVLKGYPDLWAKAYADIKGNQGALTPGIDADTLDGFCWSRVIQLQQALKEGMYRPKPVRRTLIPKANGKRRPLGISSGTDKLVQSAVKIILEAIYEPVFSDHSHGFRPKRSCHTALEQVRRKWTGVKWFIKIDIKGSGQCQVCRSIASHVVRPQLWVEPLREARLSA